MAAALPPPLHDPNTGKTFIAIPAPPFIFSSVEDRDAASHDTPQFVYVESRGPVQNRRVFSDGRNRGATKKSLGQWLYKVPSTPPPNHTPWENCIPRSMPSISESDLEDILLLDYLPQFPTDLLFQAQTCKKSSGILSTSESGYVITSFGTMSSLLRGSLPSVNSSVSWTSTIDVPPFCEASAIRHREPTCVQESSKTLSKMQSQANQVPNHREALVFEREVTWKVNGGPKRLSLQVPACEMSPGTVDMMLQLNELQDFFDTGSPSSPTCVGSPSPAKLKPKPSVEVVAPSLVVSTSTAAIPISLDSASDLNIQATKGNEPKTIPLALRRGKKLPTTLSLQPPSIDSLEYPDIPTAFRGSPVGGVASFIMDAPESCHPAESTNLSTSDMIAELRAHVEHFEEELLASGRCGERKGGGQVLRPIREEPESTFESSRLNVFESCSKQSGAPPDMPVTASIARNRNPALLKSDAEEDYTPSEHAGSRKFSMSFSPAPERLLLPSQNLKKWLTATKTDRAPMPRPRRATTGSADVGNVSTSIRKRVRFTTIPQMIPEDILELKQKKLACARPPVNTIEQAETDQAFFRGQSMHPLKPSPLREILAPGPPSMPQPSVADRRARRQSTGTSKTLPAAPSLLTRIATPSQHSYILSPQRQGSLPMSPITTSPLSSLNSRKENDLACRKVSVMFNKNGRKSVTMNENVARREKTDEVKRGIRLSTIKTKSSPLQSMINRLKT